MVDYRGATVEDLQLSPALVLPVSTSIGTALQLAFERDFSILPLHASESRATLLGWLSVDELKPAAERGELDLDAPLSSLQVATEGGEARRPVKEFKRGRRYQVITPDTPLEELEAFFSAQDTQFALVTDASRKFVLGIVTVDDLKKFTQRRYPGSAPQTGDSTSASQPPAVAGSAGTNAQPVVA